MVFAFDSKLLWFLTRGSGVVSLIMLSLVVVLGILTTAGWSTAHVPRFAVQSLHRNTSLAALLFLIVHISTTVIDSYVNVSWVDVVVPFHSSYKAVWTGVGSIAFDCLLVLIGTSLIRRHIPYRLWRFIHWLAYVCWPVAALHAFGIGSDARRSWMIAIEVAVVIIPFLFVLVRRVTRPADPIRTALALIAQEGRR